MTTTTSALLLPQPYLFPIPAQRDRVYTPPALAQEIVDFFQPTGTCLDPCRGGGAFYDRLPPESRKWCEITQGRDFFAWQEPVDWIVSNPPYTHLLAWIRHSFKVAHDIVYLIPPHRIMASADFFRDLFAWGGIVHIRNYGPGSRWGFPFSHAVAAVHFRAGYTGPTAWSTFTWTWKHLYSPRQSPLLLPA